MTRYFGLAASIILLTTGAMTPVHSQELSMKFSAFVPESNPSFKCGVSPLIEDLEAAGVTIERYFGGAGFGSPLQQFDQVRDGIVDMSFGVTAYTEGQFPLTEMVAIPTVIDDAVKGTKAINGELMDEFLAKEFEGVRPLQVWSSGLYSLHMRDEISDITDLSGLRIRAAGDANVKALQAMGAQVVFFPAPQMYESLQKGVVDGAHVNWASVFANKTAEVVDHHYNIDMGTVLGFTIINQERYDALPEKVKAVIDKHTGVEPAARQTECFKPTDSMGKKFAADQNNTVHDLTPEQKAAITEQVKPVVEARVEELESEGLPAKEYYARLLAELEKLN